MPTDPDSVRDATAIRALYEAWYGAMERGDVSTVLSLVTHDVILKVADTPPLAGRDALEEALDAFFAAHSEVVEYDVEEIEVSHDLAFARISERARIESKDGSGVLSVDGIHLAVLRRQADGAWLVARDFSSLNGAPDAT